MIEAARQIASCRSEPRRTVRVVLFANEENGLAGADGLRQGARGRAAAARARGARPTSAPARLAASPPASSPAALPAFAAVAGLLAPLGVDAAAATTAGGGADLIPLAPARVPLFDLRQDGTLYFDFHHTANDTLAQVDEESLHQNVAASAVLALAAARWRATSGVRSTTMMC